MPAKSPAPPLPRSGQPRAWWRVPASRSALAWHAARAARAHGAPLLLVARDTHAAHQLEADLHTLLGRDADLPVVLFPDWETLPWDRFSPHPDIVSQRLATLLRLPSLERPAVDRAEHRAVLTGPVGGTAEAPRHCVTL